MAKLKAQHLWIFNYQKPTTDKVKREWYINITIITDNSFVTANGRISITKHYQRHDT